MTHTAAGDVMADVSCQADEALLLQLPRPFALADVPVFPWPTDRLLRDVFRTVECVDAPLFVSDVLSKLWRLWAPLLAGFLDLAAAKHVNGVADGLNREWLKGKAVSIKGSLLISYAAKW